MWKGIARQATDDIIIRPISLACWLTTVTATHSDIEYKLLLHGKYCCAKAPQSNFYTYTVCFVKTSFNIISHPPLDHKSVIFL